MHILKKGITNAVDWVLHSVLSEKHKETLKNLFTEEQKNKIKEITKFGRKHQQKIAVKQLKDHLYSLGFRNQSLREMKEWYKLETDSYVKRLLAWELMLWYVNQHTKKDAQQALEYVHAAKRKEKDANQMRRIAVIQAECLLMLGDEQKAKAVIQTQLNHAVHPDLYLAMANTEQTLESRLTWINKAYKYYDLSPITFTTLNEPTYDDMVMAEVTEPVYETGKVSVILPVFKAEDGLKTAVESILNQTWSNIEVLIVDDCSPDKTYEVMEEYAAKDKRVKIFQTPQNSGPYVARNIALQVATGEFVTVNDADDWSHEKKIEQQVRHLIAEPDIIANTSEHARLTEELYLYRRGTPGRYIFPNMSSTMFRRQPVMEKLGYWNSVRFAADGEFKRRLIKVFGEDSFVDLPTGPLSLPRQAVASLTSSSAFGYNGFFMGVRKEYVESLEYHHKHAPNMYYEFPQTSQPFPVPEPMWPIREEKQNGSRYFDVVVAADFRSAEQTLTMLNQIIEKHPKERIGLIQLYQFDLTQSLDVADEIRQFINGDTIQMLVYGEKVNAEITYLIDYNIIYGEQTYIPTISTNSLQIIVQESMEEVESIYMRIQQLFQPNHSVILPLTHDVRKELPKQMKDEIYFTLAEKDWMLNDEQ